MPDQDLIDGLITTYRELNAKVRPLPEDRLRIQGNGGGGGSIRDSVTRLRDVELRVSQALRQRITGVTLPQIFDEDDAPVLGTEGAADTTASILSQFGTARESTLAMLRALPDEDWDRAEGGQPIRSEVRQLYDNDRKQLERIFGLLGAP